LAVFVWDKHRKPLMPCCEKRAHLVLTRGYLTRTKVVYGFKIGDGVWAVVLQGKNAGLHVGRVAVRATGSFNVGKADGINASCKLLHCADGYAWRPRAFSPCLTAGASTRGFR
jgi:hypothetical protein